MRAAHDIAVRSSLVLSFLMVFGCSLVVAQPPNILVIFTDDLDFGEVAALAGYGDRALAGEPSRKVHPLTPNLDRLVSQGMVFTQFHVASVVCTPSRYALLTGQYCSRSKSLQEQHPVTGPANVQFNTDILPGQWHLARGLKAAGYTTGIVGKWHNTSLSKGEQTIRPPICDFTGKENGPQDPLLPENLKRINAAYACAISYLCKDIGWDYASSIYMGNANQLGLPKPLWEQESNMEWFTAGALKFLDQQKGTGKPFFLYFAPNIPHGGGERFLKADPRGTPEGLVDWHLGVQPSRADVLRRVREAGADRNKTWATWLDDGIGVILKKLDDLGLAENTLVIFSSDQQTDGKWTCYEGARVPLTMRWPGRVKPGATCDALLNSIDFVPTILDLCGGSIPGQGEAIVDGRSFAPLLGGGAVPERPVFIEMGYGRAVISRGWKYIAIRYPADIQARLNRENRTADYLGRIGQSSEPQMQKRWPAFNQPDQLYDLKNDPLEKKNLVADPAQAERLAEMKALLARGLQPLPHVFGEFVRH